MNASCTPSSASPPRRSYDHRIRQAICDTGNPALFDAHVSIPRPTAKSWIRRGHPRVVSLDDGDFEVVELQQQIAGLNHRIKQYSKVTRRLAAVIRLQRVELTASGFSLRDNRVPEAVEKKRILDGIARAASLLPLMIILKILSLSSSRFHAWRRAAIGCGLDDRSSCPRTSPTQVTAHELMTMKEFALSEEYRHMPVSTLALYAQRVGKLFASASTWCKKIRERGWKRPRRRVYPARPRVGIRADKPNEIWHVDATVIRLLDGTKFFLHAVIDNFSRRILAWRFCEKLDPMTTVAILKDAAAEIGITPTLVADSGVGNVNSDVDALIEDGLISRVLALVEVTYSNSMIESYWRSLKHQWLFLNQLDNFRTLEKLVSFHIDQHNRVMPHSAFRGQTPDEVYFCTGEHVVDHLARARQQARRERLATNRALSCAVCEPKSPANSSELQLHRPRF